MDFQSQIEGTIERFLKLQKAGGIDTSNGLVFYDLEARAKFQYPVLAPIRQRMPRIGATNPGGGQGLAAHWNAITNPNTGNVPAEAMEGQSGALLSPTVVPRVAYYKLLALDGNATWLAEWAGYGYEDVRAAAQRMQLDAMILQEEPRLLWGNSGTPGVGISLGQPAQPTGTPVASGGFLATNATYYIAVAALTYQGLVFAQNSTSLSPFGIGVQPQYTKNNGDGTQMTMNGGVGKVSVQSAAVSVTSATSVGSITAAVTAIPGACAYAWFLGTTTGLGNLYFSKISSTNVVTLTTLNTSAGGYQAANYSGYASDYSGNPYSFDGLIPQCISGGGYFASLDGAALTSDDAGGVNEINTALKYQWDNYKISPTRIYAGSGTINSMTKVMLQGGASSSFSWHANVSNTPGDMGNLSGAVYIGTYNNRFALGARKPIPIDIHPNMPDGHIFFDLEINPYPSANIPYARAVRTLRDYFMVSWPATSPNWRTSIFCASMLQNYVPYGGCLISNVANS